VVDVSHKWFDEVAGALESHGRRLGKPGSFKVHDLVFRIVGVGSLGVRRYLASLGHLSWTAGPRQGIPPDSSFCCRPVSSREVWRRVYIAVGVEQQDAVPHRGDDRALALFALAQRNLRLLPFGDVTRDAERADDGPVSVAKRHLGCG
jgi:hypothetical protein